MSLVDAIPLDWRLQLKKYKLIPTNPQQEAVHIKLLTISKPISLTNARELYWLQKERIKEKPSCINKWLEKYQFEFTETQWKFIFSLPLTITLNAKLREFQFKIIHRTYASDSFVSHFDKTVDENCNRCNQENNLVHLFAECKNVKPLWNKLLTWYNNIFGTDVIVSTREIIFGIISPKEQCLNFLILHLKWFVHKCKRKEQDPWFIDFLPCIKYEIELQKSIATKNDNLDDYNTVFRKIEEAL
jgi:hypothetical protein